MACSNGSGTSLGHPLIACNPITLLSLTPAPLQLVPRSTGYVPLGLFPALVVDMSEAWDLKEGERFRNRIQFKVRAKDKPTSTVEFRQHPSYLELRLLKQASTEMDLSVLVYCHQQLWKALLQVSSRYLHMRNVVWQCGFCFPGSLQSGGQPHSAVCMTNENPMDMECVHKPCCKEEDFHLEDKHKSWFKVRSMNQYRRRVHVLIVFGLFLYSECSSHQ